MESLMIELQSMYGDHHVLEVRRILSEIPGMQSIFASSCFHVVEIQYDPAQVDPETIKSKLAEAGYLDELPVPSETGVPVYGTEDTDTFFRHTTAYEQTRQTVSFSQRINYSGRPLWPCPGLGPLKKTNGGNGHA